MAMELQMKVAQAVQVLNNDIYSCNRVAANQWLVEFQQTDAAWEVATSILASNSPFVHGFEVELFAAQILKRKIQTEGGGLQPEARNALQTALLLAAKKYSSGPPPLLTQICLALSALVLRSIEVKKPIEQLFASLNELQGQGNGSSAILQLLTVLPEEVIEDQRNNSTVGSDRRWHFSQELLSHTPAVLEFLLHQIENNVADNIQMHENNRKILRCLLSWVRVGCFLEIPQNTLPGHPMLNFVYSSLQVSSSFDLAIEVLTELVSRYEGLPQALLSRVQSLKDGLLLPALASGNEKVISGLACLMAEIGQAAPALIAEASPEAIILADGLLRTRMQFFGIGFRSLLTYQGVVDRRSLPVSSSSIGSTSTDARRVLSGRTPCPPRIIQLGSRSPGHSPRSIIGACVGPFGIVDDDDDYASALHPV